MRTTVTLDADVAELLDEAVHRERRPFKAVINDAIRRGLSPRVARRAAAPYRVTPHHSELMPGIDPAAFNRLAGELEDEEILRKATRR
jgi:hypothetical protein